MKRNTFTARWSTHAMPVATGLWRLRHGPDLQISPDRVQWHRVHRGPHSRIYRVDGDHTFIAKLIIPRSQPRDSIRKYGLCQAWRETKGNRLLANLGLKTMAVHGWGMTASPLARYESVLFMQPLPQVTSGLTFIRTERNTQQRLAFLRQLAEQLACMLKHGLIHKDAHFDNVYLSADNELIWIDNDLRQPRTQAKRRHGFQKMLSLLKTTARNDLHPDEWQYLTHTLGTCLKQTPQAKSLADEIS